MAEDPTRTQKNPTPTEEQCRAICSDAQARIFDEGEKRIFQICRNQNLCFYVKAPPRP
jgi:hypothetical protein